MVAQNTTQNTAIDPVTGEVYGPYVPYKPPPPREPCSFGSITAGPCPAVAGRPPALLPTARYVPNARTRPINRFLASPIVRRGERR